MATKSLNLGPYGVARVRGLATPFYKDGVLRDGLTLELAFMRGPTDNAEAQRRAVCGFYPSADEPAGNTAYPGLWTSRIGFHLNGSNNPVARMNNGVKYCEIDGAGGAVSNSNFERWSLVAVLTGTPSLTLYKDGVVVGTKYLPDGYTFSSSEQLQFAIGDLGWQTTTFGSRYTDTFIYDIRLWDGARTQQNIQDYMHHVFTDAEANAQSDLLLHYPFYLPETDTTVVPSKVDASIGTIGGYTLAKEGAWHYADILPTWVTPDATKLSFTTSPSTSMAGQLLSPQPVVKATDDGGTPVAWAGDITVALKNANIPLEATVTGTTTIPFVNGVAEYTDIGVDKAGENYVFTITSGTMTVDTSPVNVGTVPTNFNMTNPTNTTISCSWDNITTATKYRIVDVNNNNQVVKDGITSNSTLVENLQSLTSYTWAVQAYIGGAWTGNSNSDTEMTISNASPPTNPVPCSIHLRGPETTLAPGMGTTGYSLTKAVLDGDWTLAFSVKRGEWDCGKMSTATGQNVSYRHPIIRLVDSTGKYRLTIATQDSPWMYCNISNGGANVYPPAESGDDYIGRGTLHKGSLPIGAYETYVLVYKAPTAVVAGYIRVYIRGDIHYRTLGTPLIYNHTLAAGTQGDLAWLGGNCRLEIGNSKTILSNNTISSTTNNLQDFNVADVLMWSRAIDTDMVENGTFDPYETGSLTRYTSATVNSVCRADFEAIAVDDPLRTGLLFHLKGTSALKDGTLSTIAGSVPLTLTSSGNMGPSSDVPTWFGATDLTAPGDCTLGNVTVTGDTSISVGLITAGTGRSRDTSAPKRILYVSRATDYDSVYDFKEVITVAGDIVNKPITGLPFAGTDYTLTVVWVDKLGNKTVKQRTFTTTGTAATLPAPADRKSLLVTGTTVTKTAYMPMPTNEGITLRAFIRRNAGDSSANKYIFGLDDGLNGYSGGDGYNRLKLYLNSSNQLILEFTDGDLPGSTKRQLASGVTLSTGTWYEVWFGWKAPTTGATGELFIKVADNATVTRSFDMVSGRFTYTGSGADLNWKKYYLGLRFGSKTYAMNINFSEVSVWNRYFSEDDILSLAGKDMLTITPAERFQPYLLAHFLPHGTGATTAPAFGSAVGAVNYDWNIALGSNTVFSADVPTLSGDIPGTADHLTVTRNPAGGFAGQPFTTQPRVEVRDATEDVVTSYVGNAVLTLKGATAGGGTPTLSGLKTLTVTDGVAAFTNLSINMAGTGYQLTATANGLTAADSAAFNVVANTPVARSLRFVQNPTTSVQGAAITPAVTVEVLDQYGVRYTGSNVDITVAIKNGTGGAGAILGGTKTKTTNLGIATFDNLTVDTDANGYVLTANSTNLTGCESALFNVTEPLVTVTCTPLCRTAFFYFDYVGGVAPDFAKLYWRMHDASNITAWKEGQPFLPVTEDYLEVPPKTAADAVPYNQMCAPLFGLIEGDSYDYKVVFTGTGYPDTPTTGTFTTKTTTVPVVAGAATLEVNNTQTVYTALNGFLSTTPANNKGKTITLRGGTYMQALCDYSQQFKWSGTADGYITVQGAPGETVIFDGSDPRHAGLNTGKWTPFYGTKGITQQMGIYESVATFDWEPANVYYENTDGGDAWKLLNITDQMIWGGDGHGSSSAFELSFATTINTATAAAAASSGTVMTFTVAARPHINLGHTFTVSGCSNATFNKTLVCTDARSVGGVWTIKAVDASRKTGGAETGTGGTMTPTTPISTAIERANQGVGFCIYDRTTKKLYIRLHGANGSVPDPNTKYIKIAKVRTGLALYDVQYASTPLQYVKFKNIRFQYFGINPLGVAATGDCGQNNGIRCINTHNVIFENVEFKGTGGIIKQEHTSPTSVHSSDIIFKNVNYREKGCYPDTWGYHDWNTLKGGAFDNCSTHSIPAGNVSVLDCTLEGLFNGTSINLDRAWDKRNWEIDNNTFIGIGDDVFELEKFIVGVAFTRNKMRKCYKGVSSAPLAGGPAYFVLNEWLGRGEYVNASDRQAFSKLGNDSYNCDTGLKLFYHNTVINMWVDEANNHLYEAGKPLVGAFSKSGRSFAIVGLNNYSASDCLAVDLAIDLDCGYPQLFDGNHYKIWYADLKNPYSPTAEGYVAQAHAAITRQGETPGITWRAFKTFKQWQVGDSYNVIENMPGFDAVKAALPESDPDYITYINDPHTTVWVRPSDGRAIPRQWIHDPNSTLVTAEEPTVDLTDPYAGNMTPLVSYSKRGVRELRSLPQYSVANVTYDCGPGWAVYDINLTTPGADPYVGAVQISNDEPPPPMLDHIEFSTQPVGANAGSTLATQPVIKAVNNDGTIATSYNGTVTVALKTGIGPANATLSGTTGKTFGNGYATYTNLSVNKAGTYQLTASSGTMTVINSDSFTMTPVATKLKVLRQPIDQMAVKPQVAAVDDSDNVVASFTGDVTATVSGDASLTGTNPVAAVAGVADFADLGCFTNGTFHLTFSADGLTSVSSNDFTISGPHYTGPTKFNVLCGYQASLPIKWTKEAGITYTVSAATNTSPAGSLFNSGNMAVVEVNGDYFLHFEPTKRGQYTVDITITDTTNSLSTVVTFTIDTTIFVRKSSASINDILTRRRGR